jgi:homoserine dehydrogenase
MEAHKKLVIGLFGFGTVGEGLYKILQQTPSCRLQSKKFALNIRRRKEMHRLNYSRQIKISC